MKFLLIYFPVSLGIAFGYSAIRQTETKPEAITATLNYQTAVNVSVGPNTVLSSYPESGVDFVLDYGKGQVTIGSDAGQKTYKAEVFRLSDKEWTATWGGQYVTVNAESGTTDRLVDGEYRCFNTEHP